MTIRKKRLAWLLPVAVVVAALLAQTSITSCSPSETTSTPSSTTPATTPQTSTQPTGATVTVNLAAKNMAFDKKTLTVPAGALVTIEFDNQDSGIPHNFALYQDSSASQTIFKGETINGPKKTTYRFTAPSKPGTYFFRCDVHPVQMTGDLVVQ